MSYRFCIQLVDALTLEDAKKEFTAMFGERVAKDARYSPGTRNLLPKRRRGAFFKPQNKGFRVFIPEDVILPDVKMDRILMKVGQIDLP